ncbi:hypothetical protein AYI70_g1791 [Smittium culicis]|uniref:Uncharacterized protein n=1 Tax=Smittium culicis TaxID=133412 RepID=A0A1R1YB25_9FUNG|nr:hypothetical protein AYI70_g1791 [Smittium culicis]
MRISNNLIYFISFAFTASALHGQFQEVGDINHAIDYETLFTNELLDKIGEISISNFNQVYDLVPDFNPGKFSSTLEDVNKDSEKDIFFEMRRMYYKYMKGKKISDKEIEKKVQSDYLKEIANNSKKNSQKKIYDIL